MAAVTTRIGIIGAGHAGVAAAQAAAGAGAAATLFSGENVPPYYRPRLTAYAFGQAESADLQMHPPAWYRQQGIDLRLDHRVSDLDIGRRRVTAGGEPFEFDALVIATGAGPAQPPFAAAAPAVVLPLWNLAQAAEIRRRVRRGGSLVIAGGGILGIEAALCAVDAGLRTVIVQRAGRLMPAQFGPRAAELLTRRLAAQGIEIILDRGVARAAAENGGARLELDDGRALAADFCLVSAGARPDTELAARAGLATGRGVIVDAALRTSCPGCFAAGDAAQVGTAARCSAAAAAQQGRVAGANAVALAQGRTLQTCGAETPPLSFRRGVFELYAYGQPGGEGCREEPLPGASERVIRLLVFREDALAGVQMVGTRAEFEQYAGRVRATQPKAG